VTPERFQQARQIFERAVEREAAERRPYVAGACGTDDELRAEVEALLDAHEQKDGFSLTAPLVGSPDAERERTGVGSPSAPVSPSTRVKLCVRCHSRFIAGETLCPNDGEVLVYDPEALLGVTLDNTYRIERLLGRGAMGMVYLARHALLRDKVAIKVMPAELTSDPDFLRRFMREGRAARAINHPNAVTVHDLRISGDGIAYMVLEYIDGTTLRGYLHGRGPLPPSEALAILEPVASALDMAHARGVVHRDLKPDNVMLGMVGGQHVVKLMDLGIAKMLASPDSTHGVPTALTIPGQIMGTPQYMSPEQWGELPEDGGTDIDARGDVYSLGVILFEMIAGYKPFSGQSIQEIRRAHVLKVAPLLHTIVDGLPAAASAAVARALSKDRSERQVSAGQLVAELRAAMAGGPAEERTLLARETDMATIVRRASELTLSELRARSSPAKTTEDTRRQTPGTNESDTLAAGAPSSSAPGVGIRSWRLLAVGAAVVLLVAAATGFWLLRGESPSAAPTATVAPLAPERSLEYVLVTQKYRDGKPSGDPFPSDGMHFYDADHRVRFEVSSPQDGALFIVNEDPKPDEATGLPLYTVLFPDPAVNNGSPRLAANQSVRTGEIGFDARKGTEKVWLIWTSEPNETLDALAKLDLERDASVTNPAHVAALRDILAGAPKPGATTDDDTRRTIVRVNNSTLIHLLRLRHE
jgi:serine/threonine protein kinase